MKLSRYAPVAVLALTTVAGSALAWREYLELVRLRAQVESDDSAALKKRLDEAEKRLGSAQDQLAATRASTWRGAAGASAGPGQPGGPGGPGEDLRRTFGGGFFDLLNDPKGQALMAVQLKGMLDSRYSALFKSLNLTPQQVDQFKNLLVQKQQAVLDALAAARQQGLDPRTDPAGFRQAITDAASSVDSQIQAALGDAGYAQYQQFAQTLPQRNTVSQLQQSLSYTSTPLTDDQASQLVQVLAQTSPQRNEAANVLGIALRGGPAGLNQTAPVTAAALTQAQGILSAPQIQALQQIQQQQQAQAQMEQLMRASRPAAGAAAPGATASKPSGG